MRELPPDAPAARALAHQRDRALVRRVLDGERVARDELVERLRCAPRILRVLNSRAGRLLTDAELADLSQDVLLRIWEKLSEFEGRATLETWTYRFCWLESRNRFRRAVRRQEPRAGSAPGALSQLPAPEVALKIEFEALEISLAELGPPGAEVIRLKHFEGRTFREIGEVLEIPANTAKTHYYRGLEWLRRRLRTLGEGSER
jgi:RNA polymerase sigma-70 factor (ECF subfamily)